VIALLKRAWTITRSPEAESLPIRSSDGAALESVLWTLLWLCVCCFVRDYAYRKNFSHDLNRQSIEATWIAGFFGDCVDFLGGL